MKNNLRVALILSSVVLIVITLVFFRKYRQEPLKIGFVGSLSSKNSQLSIDARNAVLLGVEEVNQSGGLKGRKIQLIIKDDGADPRIAIERHQEFLDENVQLIIGHMTSNMSEPVLTSQSDQLLFLSPSMGSAQLSNKDDYFLRTSPLTNNQAWTFFDLVKKTDVKSAVIVYDMMNAEYSENLAKYIETRNLIASNIDLELIPFDSRTDQLSAVAESISANKELELVFLISQSMDTAILAQYIKKSNESVLLCSVSWSMTEDLIINGGQSVEDMYFVGLYKAPNPTDDLIEFELNFFNKYNYQASFVASLAYEAFQVMIQAIEKAPDASPESVKEEIINLGPVIGLEESFIIDEFGDNNRKYLLYQLRNSKFTPIFN